MSPISQHAKDTAQQILIASEFAASTRENIERLVQNGIDAALAAVAKERDESKMKYEARIQVLVDFWNDERNEKITIIKERNEVAAQLTAAQAAIVEKDEALNLFPPATAPAGSDDGWVLIKDWEKFCDAVTKALSNTAGQALLDRLAKAEAERDEIAKRMAEDNLEFRRRIASRDAEIADLRERLSFPP